MHTVTKKFEMLRLTVYASHESNSFHDTASFEQLIVAQLVCYGTRRFVSVFT